MLYYKQKGKGGVSIVIFDLDGTLYQTHETGLPPLYAVCEQYGITLTPENEHFLFYSTTQAFLDRVAPDMPMEKRQQFAYELKWKEIEEVQKNGRLFDGVEKLLTELKKDGITMAICGMGSKEYIDAVLTRCGIKDYFTYIYHRVEGLTKAQVLKTLLAEAGVTPDECIMVGDSITDITAARENGVPFIGVSYGYGSADIASAATIADDVAGLKGNLYRMMVYAKIEKDISGYKRPIVVGVNGADTAGKTKFSLGLKNFLQYKGHDTELVCVDDFHNPRSVRMKDHSAEGYLSNAFDLSRLYDLLTEMKTGPVDKKTELLDLDTDTYTNEKHYKTGSSTIVIVEGSLLYRPPIAELIDYKIFLDIDMDEVLHRAAERDVPKYGEAIMQKYKERYMPAQQIYFRQYAPQKNCQLLVDNNDFNKPFCVCAEKE